ncbi:uncharacterized protein GGS25DRAFT_518408 [Hypoxylon fragiforme]|uniref:uncharacterized protein n=1 Tax=Hypoxylon fragiforme TaxID=63214 RepID=UPI0020C6080D|nr:uncharacterized protein GGS25DRAFT_518408 [Hypoxylon fragiforme]KAI2612723.1 hypothetical protein GGS25DRAFT_518408 [Hypoxylon fragiforme]
MLSKTFSVALATVVGLLLSPAGVFATPAVEPRAYGGYCDLSDGVCEGRGICNVYLGEVQHFSQCCGKLPRYHCGATGNGCRTGSHGVITDCD